MLKQQNSDGGKIHKGQEGNIRLAISGGDSAKPLDFLEKTLHQMALLIQMPFKVPPGTKTITKMAPTKSNDRLLPITEETLPYFLRQLDLIERQKELLAASGGEYYDNKLLIAKPDGSPHRRDRMSANFGQLIRHLEMPHIRFHDLRHPYVKHTTKITYLQKQKSQTTNRFDSLRFLFLFIRLV